MTDLDERLRRDLVALADRMPPADLADARSIAANRSAGGAGPPWR
jgi:hypothetical protein